MPANISRLTDPSAVRAAIAECDRLTRDVFLKTYGYKASRLYPLLLNGRSYDSKAIVGVAFGKQHGTPLKYSEFSGGLATVVPLLERLGFPIIETSNPAVALTPGRTYSRKELLTRYGGQLQSFIWTPKEFPVVFLFSGESGKSFGYNNGWKDKIFEYTDEGQKGPMTFGAGNKAIRDHRKNGKDLLLFIDLGKGRGVRFEGLFECASYRVVDGLDKDRHRRKIIVFDLASVSTAATELGKVESVEPEPDGAPPKSIEALRKAAYAAANASAAPPRVGDAGRMWYERSRQVRSYVLAKAQGLCEACGEKAPFLKRDGSPYLEPIIRPDWLTKDWTIRAALVRYAQPVIAESTRAAMRKRGTYDCRCS